MEYASPIQPRNIFAFEPDQAAFMVGREPWHYEESNTPVILHANFLDGGTSQISFVRHLILHLPFDDFTIFSKSVALSKKKKCFATNVSKSIFAKKLLAGFCSSLVFSSKRLVVARRAGAAPYQQRRYCLLDCQLFVIIPFINESFYALCFFYG